jgi:hypothetical protein
MAINIWEQGGRPTSYNPMPIGWGVVVTALPSNMEYVVSFRAKSATGKTFTITKGGAAIDVKLTPEFQDYKYTFLFSAANFHFYYDGAAGPSDIIIENIYLAEKPTGETTINGVDGFGSVKPGFNEKLSAFGDFAGKVQGDLSGNPHVAWRTGTNPPVTSLLTPNSPKLTGGGWYNEFVQDALGGTRAESSNGNNGGISQHMFTFDIIALLEKQITVNAIPYADKIAWMNDNINKISVDWYGFGSGPAGNRASLKLWYYGSSAWGATTDTHTSGAITKLNRSISSNIADTIGPGGFVHAIAYADASNGIIPSVVATDYVSITVEMKQEAIVDSKWTLPPNAKIIDNETLELEATYTNQGINLEFDVEPNTEYTANSEVGLHAIANTSGVTTGLLAYGSGPRSFNSGANSKLRFYFSNTSGGPGKYTFKRPMLNKGPGFVPYEPKRGERMVLPVINKNMFNPAAWVKGRIFDATFMPTDFRVEGNTVTIVAVNNSFVSQIVRVKPNTNYVVHHKNNNSYGIYVYTKTGVGLNPVSKDSPVVFNSGDNTELIIGLYKSGSLSALTEATFIEPQMEEGAGVTQYEPFRVQRAKKINGVPKKNMIRGEKEQDNTLFNQGTGTGSTDNRWENGKLRVENGSSNYYGRGQMVKVKKGETYTFACKGQDAADAFARVLIGSTDKGNDYTTEYYPNTRIQITFVAVTDEVWIRFLRNGQTDAAKPVYFWDIQLEPGDTKTAYEPFKLQARRAVKERIVGKNLFPGFVPGYITAGVLNENPTSPDVGQVTSKWMPCEPNTPYTVSGGDRNTWHFKNTSGVINGAATIPNPTTPSDAAFMRVYYSTNGSHKNIQVEKGLSPTTYEPTKFAGRPARRGLEFNGITDRIQVNKDFAGLSNKNFEIESVFDYNPANPGGYSQQSIVSCGDIRFGVSNVNLPQIGFYTPSSGWVAVTHSEIKTNKTRLKAVITPTNVKIFINDVLVADKAYTGAINATPQTMLHIGAYGTAQYFFGGALHSVKMKSEGVTLFDFDFTKPSRNLITKFKDNTGIDGVIYGNPLQLNRQARR